MRLRACHSHVLRDIKLILSVYVFKYNFLWVSLPKNKIVPKPEVNHKKVKIEQWVQITPLTTDFAPKKILNQIGSA